MNNKDRTNDEKLDRALRDFPTPPPPAGLLEKLKAEIPSADVLAGAKDPNAAKPSNRNPWPLRIAATFVLAMLGGTVAWQVMKTGSARTWDGPMEIPKTDAFSADLRTQAHAGIAVPPPQQSPKAVLPKPVAGQSAGGDPATSSSPESLLVKDEARGGLARNRITAQPVEVPEPVSVGATVGLAADSAVESEGVEGGVAGGVVGGVPGGVAGGVPGGISGAESSYAFQAAPRPAVPAPRQNPELKDKRAEGRVDRAPAERARPIAESDGSNMSAAAPRRTDEPEFQDTVTTPDTMIFRETPENRFVDAREDQLSTFALDVDTGSYTLTRGYLDRGTLPPPEAVRVEEFVNAQVYDDAAPRRGDFALFAEGAPAPFYGGENTRLLRFAVKAREIDPADRKSAVLTFAVDVSGSMGSDNRLGLVKRALGLLLDELRPDDRVGLVVYGTNGRVLLHHTRDLSEIRRAIARLEPEGSTNVEEGLEFAYDLADEGWKQGAINKIILCSDGVANVGPTGPEAILARIGKEAQRGIELTTVGFGMGNYNDELMEQLADQGDGTYHYVDQLDEARKVFVDNLTGTLETVARDAKAQVDFDPSSVVRWRLLGYENRDVADRDFRNDKIDAGELGSGHQATALYEVRLRPGISGSNRIATLHLRWKSVATKEIVEASRELRVRDLDRNWEEASANFHQAALAGAFAERLKETRAGDEIGWRMLNREAGRLDSERRRNGSAHDLADSIQRATRISGYGDRDERDDRGDRDDRKSNPRLNEE
ncbi:MAG: von Willebrand factor type A domain-containing protein [Thermoanaerobaculia bacterium]